MKNLIIVLSVFLTVITVASAQKATQNEVQKTTYTCPMHPDQMSITGGKCSKCGMEMVKTTGKMDTQATKASQPKSKFVTKYVCSMDGTTSDKTGKCSKCGMKLVKTTERKYDQAVKGSQARSHVVTKYVCSMDGTTSDKPGKCSKCGMEMNKVVDDENHQNHKH